MNRPTIRRQPSSEWRRVERDEKLRKIQEQGIPLDLQNLVQDEEVKVTKRCLERKCIKHFFSIEVFRLKSNLQNVIKD